MSSKNIINFATLGAGASNVIEYPTAIPAGKTWVIRVFGACDINMGDSKSSEYMLRLGSENIQPIVVTGDTHEIRDIPEITGDGSKKIGVYVKNNSVHPKAMPFWIRAYER